jgi:IS30 family transposase
MMHHTTAQENCYTHLSLDEREETAACLEQGKSLRMIAAALGRSPSAARSSGTPLPGGISDTGKQSPSAGLRPLPPQPRRKVPAVRAYVQSYLVNDRWSSQEISGRLPLDHPELSTNYESIYRIYGERRDLIKYLLRAHKKHRKRPLTQKRTVQRYRTGWI